ncbi:15067_t:CDS:2, partial [Cetraspora pellucida]
LMESQVLDLETSELSESLYENNKTLKKHYLINISGPLPHINKKIKLSINNIFSNWAIAEHIIHYSYQKGFVAIKDANISLNSQEFVYDNNFIENTYDISQSYLLALITKDEYLLAKQAIILQDDDENNCKLEGFLRNYIEKKKLKCERQTQQKEL